MKTPRLEGPIVVLGAGGFIGQNLRKKLCEGGMEVYGVYRQYDLGKDPRSVIELLKPRVIFDCMSYGGYLHQIDVPRIYETNVGLKARLLELAFEYGSTYIHLGSSSEYGEFLGGPYEDGVPLLPNTHYSASKIAASNLIHYFGKHKNLRCANLRLYAVYGPCEPPAFRLIPQLILHGLDGKYPPFVDPDISRDFIHVDDVCEAMVRAAEVDVRGEAFNIGTGIPTSIRTIAGCARDLFGLKSKPTFELPPFRTTDAPRPWFASTYKAAVILGWRSKIALWDGLQSTTEWYRENR